MQNPRFQGNPAADKILQHFVFGHMKQYWPPRLQLVWDGYRGTPDGLANSNRAVNEPMHPPVTAAALRAGLQLQVCLHLTLSSADMTKWQCKEART